MREAAKAGRHKPSGRGSGLTPKVRHAIDNLVFGDDLEPKDRLKQAAELAGISDRTVMAAMLKPAVEAYYRNQMAAKREGLKAVALNTIEDVMTDPKLATNAAGAKVRLDAAKIVVSEPVGSQVNVLVNTNVSVTPGYVIRIDRRGDERGQQIEHLRAHGDDATPEDVVVSSV
ncbi:hypothetical protein [Rhizobium mongolense]